MTLKYVVVRNVGADKEEIFIFQKHIDHDCLAEVLSYIKNSSHGNWRRQYRKPIAAGFTDGVKCWGRSETLGLDSRGELDEILLRG